MRHLRQEHRAEFAGADQRDADWFSGSAAGVEEAMKIHGGSDRISLSFRDTRLRVDLESRDYWREIPGSRVSRAPE
jgi:hypothetical protein